MIFFLYMLLETLCTIALQFIISNGRCATVTIRRRSGLYCAMYAYTLVLIQEVKYNLWCTPDPSSNSSMCNKRDEYST